MRFRPRPAADLELRFKVLSAEYSHATTMLTSTWSVSAARTNLFFVSVSAAGVALALLSGAGKDARTLLLLALPILLLILAIGVVAQSRMLHANRETIRYLQSIIRIRRFFVELDPGSRRYVTLPTRDDAVGLFGPHDARSSFGAMTQLPAASTATLIALVDAFVAAAIVGVVYLLLVTGDATGAVVAAGISLALGIALFEGWVYRDLGRLRRSLDVMFNTG